MRMNLKKGRRDFAERLISYAVEGDVLSRCKDHPGSIYLSGEDSTPAIEVVEAAWKSGEISGSLEGAIEQLDAIIEKAPRCCSHAKCWSKN